MNCPQCAGRAVGRIGSQHYYCWDCCVEFTALGGGWQVYTVDDEGQLMPVVAEGLATAALPAGAVALPAAAAAGTEAP